MIREVFQFDWEEEAPYPAPCVHGHPCCWSCQVTAPLCLGCFPYMISILFWLVLTCQHPAEHLRETLCRVLPGFSLYVALSLVLCPATLAASVSRSSQPHLLNSESPPGSVWVPPPRAAAWKIYHGSKPGNHRVPLICVPSSGITALHCLVASVLNTIVSYILSSV